MHLNGREVPQARGKVLGGSSAINAAALLFPTAQDFDTWTKLGNKGWTAEAMIPCYRRCLNFCAPPKDTATLMSLDSYIQPDLCGQGGPIQASFADGFGPFDAAFADAFENIGLRCKPTDPSKERLCGHFIPLSSVDPKTHTRSYATAYLTDVAQEERNVHLLVDTLVDRLLFSESDDGLIKASGITIRTKSGECKEIFGDDIILAAGSLQTPQVLERSGIGARHILEQHGIPIVIDNPGVGENLQDHVWASISYEVSEGLETGDAVRDGTLVQGMVDQYIENHSGPLGNVPLNYAFLPPVDASGLLRSSNLEELVTAHGLPIGAEHGVVAAGRDAQLNILKTRLLDPVESACYYSMFPGQQNINPSGRTTMQEMHTPIGPDNFITISAGLNHPLSRGSVHIAGLNPETPPHIDPAYLSHPLDMELLSRGLQFVETVIEQDAMKTLLKPNGRRIPDYAADISDLATSKHVVSDRLWGNYHPACSCPMLPRELGGVVNDRLVVFGTSNVRIFDASVFPVITQGNIQATVYAVAERACDLIKEDWASSGRC